MIVKKNKLVSKYNPLISEHNNIHGYFLLTMPLGTHNMRREITDPKFGKNGEFSHFIGAPAGIWTRVSGSPPLRSRKAGILGRTILPEHSSSFYLHIVMNHYRLRWRFSSYLLRAYVSIGGLTYVCDIFRIPLIKIAFAQVYPWSLRCSFQFYVSLSCRCPRRLRPFYVSHLGSLTHLKAYLSASLNLLFFPLLLQH